jgi:hypothetical protein
MDGLSGSGVTGETLLIIITGPLLANRAWFLVVEPLSAGIYPQE